MKKNALLTFIFACIPGAGQMYYGYMQRGLSLITLFCGCFVLGAMVSPLVVTAFIVWMYSFFDTYDLIRHLAAGDPKPAGTPPQPSVGLGPGGTGRMVLVRPCGGTAALPSAGAAEY